MRYDMPYKLGDVFRNKFYPTDYTVIAIHTMETKDFVIRKYKIKSGEGVKREVGTITVEFELDEAVLEGEYILVSELKAEPERRLNRLEQI